MKLWQIVAVTVAGVLFGLVEPGKLTYAFGAITLYVLLPGLIFEGAWNLDFRAMRRQWRAIALLAVPGVILTALIIAGALAIVHVPFSTGLLTGAILSATDPIAVIAAFRRMRVPRLLRAIVESEALLNDAVAVMLYRGVVAGLVLGASGGTGLAIGLVSLVGAVVGTMFGIAIAIAVAFGLRRFRSARAQIVGTVVGAYGTYFIVDHLHCSGIFAVIAFGIALRFFERRAIALQIARDVEHFWGLASTVANVVVFFLVGAALNVTVVRIAPAFVIFTLLGVAVARFVLSWLLARGGYPRPWLDVIRVSGLRGALSLALAIALPQSIPGRDAIVAATFAVAIATILSSTLTVTPAVARVSKRMVRSESP